jgi:hypothetical protein
MLMDTSNRPSGHILCQAFQLHHCKCKRKRPPPCLCVSITTYQDVNSVCVLDNTDPIDDNRIRHSAILS